MMHNQFKARVISILVLSMFLSGCGSGQLLEPTIAPSSTNTSTPTIIPTPTETLTPTPTITATLAAPTEEPAESGLDWSNSFIDPYEGQYNGVDFSGNLITHDSAEPVVNSIQVADSLMAELVGRYTYEEYLNYCKQNNVTSLDASAFFQKWQEGSIDFQIPDQKGNLINFRDLQTIDIALGRMNKFQTKLTAYYGQARDGGFGHDIQDNHLTIFIGIDSFSGLTNLKPSIAKIIVAILSYPRGNHKRITSWEPDPNFKKRFYRYVTIN